MTTTRTVRGVDAVCVRCRVCWGQTRHVLQHEPLEPLLEEARAHVAAEHPGADHTVVFQVMPGRLSAAAALEPQPTEEAWLRLFNAGAPATI